MIKKLATAGMLLILMTLAIGLTSASAASARSRSTTVRYRIVWRANTYDKVRHCHRVLRVRHAERYVSVNMVPRYRVVKRTRRYIYLRRLSAAIRLASTDTTILIGAPGSVGLPSSASSTRSGNSSAAANDGQAVTRWAASDSTYPQWWMVDLGTATGVSGVKTDWYRATKRAYHYRVEASLDGVTFTTVADRRRNVNKGITSDAMNVRARFVRVQVVGVSGGASQASANEITVYTDPSSPSDPTPTPSPTTTPTSSPTPIPGGRVFCVSAGGNDNSAGTIDSPYRTLAQGVSVLAPGDTLYVRGGTYLLTSRLRIDRSGTASAPVTIASYPGETAMISGDANGNGVCETSDTPGSQWTGLVRLAGSYIIFKDIEVCYSGGRGIETNGDNNTISECSVHHAYDMGIEIGGSHNAVESCEIHHSTIAYDCGTGSDWSAGIGIGNMQASSAPGGAPHTIIRNNTVHNNWGEGIISMFTDHLLIEGNALYDNWAEQINITRSSYCTVQRNLCYWTGDATWSRFASGPVGIEFANETGQASGDPYPIGHDNKTLNNIVVGCGTNFKFWEGELASSMVNYLIAGNTFVNARSRAVSLDAGFAGTPHSGTRICDNLILQAGATVTDVDTKVGITFDHNLWSRSPAATCSGTGDVVADPLLSDPTHTVRPGSCSPAWYALTPGSPARGAGVAVFGLSEDFSGNPRNDPPDAGAQQF